MRIKVKTRRVLLIVVVAVILVGAWFILNSRGQVEAQLPEGATTAKVYRETLDAVVTYTGSLSPERSQALYFAVSGTVAEVHVSEGDIVSKGQILARLDTTDLDLSLRQARAALNASEATLLRTQKPPSAEDIAAAEAAVRAARSNLTSMQAGPGEIELQLADLAIQQAQNSLYGAQGNRDATNASPAASGGAKASAEAQVLNAEIAVTVAELQRQKLLQPADLSALRNAESQVAQAEANLARLLATPAEEDVLAAKAQVEQARINVEIAQNRLEDTTLLAPFDGQIGAWNVREGDTVVQTSPIGTLLDTSAYHVDLSADETDISKISVGQPALVSLDAYPDTLITGSVSQIAVIGNSAQGIVTYSVKIKLDPTDVDVKPLMTAAIDIIVATKEDAIVVPNRALRRDDSGKYVEVVGNGQIRRADVVTGLANDSVTEILSGVEEGQEIVVTWPRESAFGGPFGGR